MPPRTRSKKKRERGRPLVDRRVEYSNDHRWLLAFCAQRANQILSARFGYVVPPEELIAEGWWVCLRRLQEGELNRATNNTIRVMIDYGADYRPRHSPYPWIDTDRDFSLADPSPVSSDDPFEALEARDELAVLLAEMDPTLLAIGMARFGYKMTWAEIGKRYHKSRAWARLRGLEFVGQVNLRLAGQGKTMALELPL